MKVLSKKRVELSQTIALLIGSIRAEKGCKRCDFYQSIEDENELCLLGLRPEYPELMHPRSQGTRVETQDRGSPVLSLDAPSGF